MESSRSWRPVGVPISRLHFLPSLLRPPFTNIHHVGLFPGCLSFIIIPQLGNSTPLGLSASNVQASKYPRKAAVQDSVCPERPLFHLAVTSPGFLQPLPQNSRKALSRYFRGQEEPGAQRPLPALPPPPHPPMCPSTGSGSFPRSPGGGAVLRPLPCHPRTWLFSLLH